MRDLNRVTVICENILIDKNNHVKICDFRITCISDSDSQTKITGVGTLNESSHYNAKVDVYSFDVVMFFILTNEQYPQINIGEVSFGEKAAFFFFFQAT